MKTLVTLILALFISAVSFGQICGPSTDVSYEQINKTTIKVVNKNKCDKEIGYLMITGDNKLIRHGIWKSYCKGKLKMTASYEYGKMVWIQTDNQRKITYNEIVYLRELSQDNTSLAGNDDVDQ